ncbi:MAG: DUF1559 domain-containing protein [Planctomycetes bacterium]|nr:DUF1559 domain-containing protein [Planctomycetota bacterium]
MRPNRPAYTVVELLVVISIIAILIALLVPGVQRVREAANRTECANNLRQIGLALHQFHDTYHAFPPGYTNSLAGQPFVYLGWRPRLAPFLDRQAYWQVVVQDYVANPRPTATPYHRNVGVILPVFGCPSDGRVSVAHFYYPFQEVALSSYVGVSGLDHRDRKGCIYEDSRTRIADITDGLSSTVIVGERPPSNDLRWGWVYIGGRLDNFLGVREIETDQNTVCAYGPYHFQPQRLGVPCGYLQYWSMHPGGGHFLFADGSVHFLLYNADEILPALATRGQDEVFQMPF